MNKYYLRNRPISIGCQPKGYINYESWIPKKEIPNKNGITAWGWVEYNNKLTFRDIYDYELIPDNDIEWAKYTFWIEGNMKEEESDYILNSYMELSNEELINSDDRLAKLALIIKNNN